MRFNWSNIRLVLLFGVVVFLFAFASNKNSSRLVKQLQVTFTSENNLFITNQNVSKLTPIARVRTNASFYVDDEGKHMPLSTNYAARVPLITGYVDKNHLDDIYKIADKVRHDTFLKTNVIEIHQDKYHQINLKLRECTFTVHLGKVTQLDKKINNLKAFYQKNLRDNTLNQYSMVNLKFDNQVVCTK